MLEQAANGDVSFIEVRSLEAVREKHGYRSKEYQQQSRRLYKAIVNVRLLQNTLVIAF